ncbi:MAG: IS3 family transposase [bacterium]
MRCRVSGVSWDDAVSESFFVNLEIELLEDKVKASREVARVRITDFIEVFYNRQRSHQTLDYQTPLQRDSILSASRNAAGTLKTVRPFGRKRALYWSKTSKKIDRDLITRKHP